MTIAVGFVLAAAYHVFGPLSPDGVRDRALRALDQGDAGALLALANPAEVKETNLTERNVSGLLAETLRAPGAPVLVAGRIEREPNQPPDRAVYSVYTATNALDTAHRPTVTLAVTDSQDHGWRLDLTWLFYSYCKNRAEEPSGRLDYARLCNKLGVPGFLDYTLAFHSVDEIERKAREIAGTLH